MGVKNPKDLFYSAHDLSTDDIKLMTINHENRFSIDVDINWLAFKIGRGLNDPEIVRKIWIFLFCLAKNGFIVNPISDGHMRHHLKRASTERRANRERKRSLCYFARSEAMKISWQITNPDPDSNLNNLQAILLDLNKKIRSYENDMWPGVSYSFPDLLTALDTNTVAKQV